MTYCLGCGEECGVDTQNDSFDYEYGSISSTHRMEDYYVSDCCGAIVLDEQPERFGECEECDNYMEECECEDPDTCKPYGKMYQEQYEKFCEKWEEDDFMEPDEPDEPDHAPCWSMYDRM